MKQTSPQSFKSSASQYVKKPSHADWAESTAASRLNASSAAFFAATTVEARCS
jgi:hypothetical protein